ncbi:MAG: SGNH/GDSL hydrolase family protein [Clostridia bacterium]|nr:SGNH/GDSL hydrolase family protein [Clostridia bacterium]
MSATNGFHISRTMLARAWVVLILLLSVLCLAALIVLGILALTAPEKPNTDAYEPPFEEEYPVYDPDAPADPDDAGLAAHSRILPQTADAGQGYIDRMIFVGESTTAHLRSRGVLSGGTKTQQVWSNDSNTMTLDLNILKKTIRYPVSGVEMTIPEAVASAKPEYIVLSFGLNGINGFERNADLYKAAYGMLIDAIHAASPTTVVLLQTVYPVADNQTTFAEGAAVLNGYVRKLNELLPIIAEEHDAYVVDTASCLADVQGLLRADYQNGDGLHLTHAAYHAILNYLRTHAYAP